MKDENGFLFDISRLVKELYVVVKADDIVTVECILYKTDKEGRYVITSSIGGFPLSFQKFILISSRINSKGAEVILDGSGFIIPSFLKPYSSFVDRLFNSLAKGFL